jgi:dihydroflavonol-4-reductase
LAKTLVTGGAGFIGSHVARELAARGDELRLTVRPTSQGDNLKGLEHEPVQCDILDRRSVRRALKGVDRVFHSAGLVSLRPRDTERLFQVHVEGTRLLLEECLRAGVERVVYTSSVAAIGPAPPGKTADETQLFTAGRLGIPYVNSKHEAEVEAFRIAAQGLPLVVVNPCTVFGPGDVYVGSTGLVRRFLLGRIPAYTDGAFNVVDVRDVARGQVLADELGQPGERYILGNRNYTFDRFFADLSRMTGVEPPALKLPGALAIALAEALERGPGRSPTSVPEVRSATQRWAYRSTKAKRDLGWKTSPHEDALESTIAWYMDRDGERIRRGRRGQTLPWKAAGAAAKGVDRAARLGRSIPRLLPLA